MDYETTNLFTLIVKASDSGVAEPRTSKVVVTVRVVDSNDHSPVFVSVPFVANVSESVSIGQRVVRVSATDADGPGANSEISYRYSILMMMAVVEFIPTHRTHTGPKNASFVLDLSQNWQRILRESK